MRKQVLLTLGCMLMLGCGQAPMSDTAAEATSETAVKQVSFNTEGAPTVEFSVPDMMCEESCAKAVHDTLVAQPGAVDVLVDFPNKVATVAVEKEKFDSDAALAALLDKQFSNSKLITAETSSEAPAAPAAPEEPASDDQGGQG